ncbi:hypothetical protein acsn021_24290 [Anaerocolumna cellulosilytica]|uniref:Uncharacterized protein n=1 Tax=Anaerocolumna cellulosilytica TaxID=433286 RepID=A0A6S6R5Y2_9FIRM|nr:hypothetical protein [Anaerocolumna cellulosilytica]MBB5193926.1 hypothetical protein [Anaerocolumna cellulosilytica]BCJ94860.1 hypothetical protein acsn021_24290 [Anaerocolumna cellulosilytica]
MSLNNIRKNTIDTIQAMIEDKIITSSDLIRFRNENEDVTNPEYVCYEMENWYRTLGIENVIEAKFNLKLPYFTKEEIKEAYDNNEIILCVPKGITKKQLGQLFNLDCWAFDDELIGKTTESEDFWFKTKKSFVPEHLGSQGREIQRVYQNEGKLGMSLERYLVFLARMRYLTGDTPDTKHKIWIINGRYERNAMLVAGFDSKKRFTVHGWLPQFHSPFVGGRYVFIPDHI